MKKINASAVIPSHRSDTSTIRHLIATIDLFLQHGFEVVIADNSGSAKKSQQLRAEFANDLIFAKTEVDCDAFENFFAGFKAASCEYVLFVSDDDIFLPTGIQALADAIEHSVAYEGFCAPVVHHKPESTVVTTTPNLSSENLTTRLIAWTNCDIAVCFYGCYSQKIWQHYFDFINRHPLKLAYFDQFLRFFVADAEKIASLNSAWLAYDVSNWADGKSAYQSYQRFYIKAGADARMYYAEPLWEAIEGILCQCKLDELAGREIQAAFIPHWWNWRVEAFKNLIAANEHAMPREVWQALTPLINYLNSNRMDAYQILQLLSQFMIDLYGHDAGWRHFWLYQATEILKRD
jgi:hypothetical protein